jgi:hypothetical protein
MNQKPHYKELQVINADLAIVLLLKPKNSKLHQFPVYQLGLLGTDLAAYLDSSRTTLSFSSPIRNMASSYVGGGASVEPPTPPP